MRGPKKSFIPDGTSRRIKRLGPMHRSENSLRGTAARSEMKDRKPSTLGAPTQTVETKRRKSGATLSRDIQGKIGKQLRAYYGGLIEPTPDRFVDLLSQLDKPPGDKGKPEEGTPHEKGSSE
jgi:hypothetical protein